MILYMILQTIFKSMLIDGNKPLRNERNVQSVFTSATRNAKST